MTRDPVVGLNRWFLAWVVLPALLAAAFLWYCFPSFREAVRPAPYRAPGDAYPPFAVPR